MAAPDEARAVIFDLDGVLVDSEALHVEAWRVLFAREGVAATEAEYEHGVGMADAEWIRWLFARRGQPTDADWWRDAKRPIYSQILARSVRPFPGVPELIRRLHGEFRLAVASSSWRESIETVLDAMGLRPCFGALVGKQDVDRHKPHPQIQQPVRPGMGMRQIAGVGFIDFLFHSVALNTASLITIKGGKSYESYRNCFRRSNKVYRIPESRSGRLPSFVLQILQTSLQIVHVVLENIQDLSRLLERLSEHLLQIDHPLC